MSFFPDDHVVFDQPNYDPEPEEDFPIEHDIEYVGGVRLERVKGRWVCPHGFAFPAKFDTERAARGCNTHCEPDTPPAHSTHVDVMAEQT